MRAKHFETVSQQLHHEFHHKFHHKLPHRFSSSFHHQLLIARPNSFLRIGTRDVIISSLLWIALAAHTIKLLADIVYVGVVASAAYRILS